MVEDTEVSIEALDQLKTERNRFVAFAFISSDVLLECTSAGVIEYASGLTSRLGVENSNDLLGKPLHQFVNGEDHLFLNALLENAWRTGRVRPVGIHMKSTSGQSINPVLGCMRYGNKIYFSLILNAAMLASTVKKEFDRDADTGLMTKDSFLERSQDHIGKATQSDGEEDKTLTLMEISGLSDMSSKNSALAKNIERNVGALLRSWSVNGDSAGTIAPDRFGVVSNGHIDAGKAEQMIGKLCDSKPHDLKIKKVELQLDDANIADEDAARAMMFAINEFSTVEDVSQFSITTLQEGAKRHLNSAWERVTKIRNLIETRDFTMAFQPIVSLETGGLHHFEALARLPGTKSPYELVTFAEKAGMILDLDIMIATRLVETLEQKQRQGQDPKVAMNVSARSLQSTLFVDHFRRIMKAHSKVARQLALEVTETANIIEFGAFNNILQLLRKDGHEISLDDVGTGSTSFETLRQLSVDFVKIDGQYVQSAMSNKKDRAILESVVKLCSGFGFWIIGEMVETLEQQNYLKSVGIEYGQGYLFGKPASELRDLKESRETRGDTTSLVKW